MTLTGSETQPNAATFSDVAGGQAGGKQEAEKSAAGPASPHNVLGRTGYSSQESAVPSRALKWGELGLFGR